MTQGKYKPLIRNLEHVREGIELTLKNANPQSIVQVAGFTKVQADELRGMLPQYFTKIVHQGDLYTLAVRGLNGDKSK